MATSSTNTWRRSQETTLKDVVDDVSSSQKYHVESVVIVAVAFRKDATYPACTLCRRRVHLREIGFTCVSHGAQQDAPIYRYWVRVLLSQPAHPGQELWVTRGTNKCGVSSSLMQMFSTISPPTKKPRHYST